MSLVNDALKRVTAAQKPSTPALQHYLPLRPVEPAQLHQRGWGLLLPAVLLTVIVGAFFSLGHLKSPDRPAPTPPIAAAPIIHTVPPPVVQAPSPVVEPTPAPVVPPAPPALPPLRLQAVFYTPPRPSAMIGGETVRVGDSVRDLQVVAIGSTSILLVGAGRTNFLTLE